MTNFDENLAKKVSIIQGDITKLEIDAIVNSAYTHLLGRSGLDGAIHLAAGPGLKKECETLGPGPVRCEVGNAKITSGHNLPAKHVIHTVGPTAEDLLTLKSCYQKCLELMLQNRLRSIAFPCISTGNNGYPSEKAASVAINTVKEFLQSHGSQVDRIIFCIHLEKDFKIYEQELRIHFSVKTVTLYHYTDEKGKDGIERSQVIRVSPDGSKSAMKGEGVYFTSLSPWDNTRDKIIENNWTGISWLKYL